MMSPGERAMEIVNALRMASQASPEILRAGKEDKDILCDYLKILDDGKTLSPDRVRWMAYKLKQYMKIETKEETNESST